MEMRLYLTVTFPFSIGTHHTYHPSSAYAYYEYMGGFIWRKLMQMIYFLNIMNNG